MSRPFPIPWMTNRSASHLSEVDDVVENYVCAVCQADLIAFQALGELVVIICCPEHGSVEKCGRIMRSSVSIDLERAHYQFQDVIHNLPDLWGELIEHRTHETKFERTRVLRRSHANQRINECSQKFS